MMTLFEMTNILHKHLYNYSPVDTGNLHDTGLIKQQFGPNSMGVILGGRNAPYGPITTLPWIHPRGHKSYGPPKNPNEGWATKAAKIAAQEIASKIGGKIE